MRIAGMIPHSSVNGPGVRFVVFFQGCPHHCKNCQNPETWNPATGMEMDVDFLIKQITETKFIDGVTFSGGDPIFQPKALLQIAKACKEKGIGTWCYTGWLYEEIESGALGAEAKEALSYIDVLVDGPFVAELLSDRCIYRGSSNQRLVDVVRSRQEGKTVEVETLDFGI